MNIQEAMSSWRQDKAQFERRGVILPNVRSYVPDWGDDVDLAMDALPTLSTDPNSAIPMMLTTFIDPEIFQILFTPMKGAEILGEKKHGDWLMDTAMFPVVEATGEVSSYGDYEDAGGRAGLNVNFPQRQNYLFQVIIEYGDREVERHGLARINWVNDLNKAAALSLNKFANFNYFFGMNGLQNYGLLNDPNLGASLTPVTKAYASGTGKAWISGGAILATANEIYLDIESLWTQLVVQTVGLVNQEDELILAMSPTSATALTATNSFNVNVYDLLKKNFPKLRIVTASQYGAVSATNPQGIAAGNLVQMIAPEIEGQRTGYCAYSEKMRAHRIVPSMSSFKSKQTSGVWGAVLRMTMSISSLVGV